MGACAGDAEPAGGAAAAKSSSSARVFETRFLAASKVALDFARSFIEERLPSTMQFNVHLDASHDGHAGSGVTFFLEDASDEVAARTKNLSAEQVVGVLFRDGLVPQWVDVQVTGETGDATRLDVTACGRFTGGESALY